MTPEEVLDRYRRLRAVSRDYHRAAFRMVAPATKERVGRRLGIQVAGGRLVIGSESEFDLLSDLVVYSRFPSGVEPALVRHARTVRHAPGSDEAVMLDAALRARFVVFAVERRHALGGFVLRDLVDDREDWLMDIAMSEQTEPGGHFVGRLTHPGPFSMTCGVLVPLTEAVIEVIEDMLPDASQESRARVCADPRLPFLVYRAAIRGSAMETVASV